MGNCISCGGVNEVNSSGACSSPTCSPCTQPDSPCGVIIGGSGMSNCGCNNSGCSGGCGNVQCASPQPYYQTAPLCAEDHQKCVVNQSYVTAIKIDNSWNVPACGGSSVIKVSGLSNILIGSYIWNPSFGYFQVVGFTPFNSQIIIQNNCNTGNSTVGTMVPACSNFIVAPPPLSSSGGGGTPSIYPYLAVDFTAPNNGDCILVTLTTTQGLSVGKNVQIGTGVYEVSSISDATHMTICNNGLGAVPGTPVIAQDAGGNYQYPVILIDTNACTNAPVASGALMVCSGNLQQPLLGTTAGSIPVLIDEETGEVEFQLLNVPTRTCSPLTACLILVPGQVTYVMTVGDSSQFTVGDIVQVGTRADRFTVTVINDATHITAVISVDPAVITDIAPGTSVCLVDCCESLAIDIADLQDEIDILDSRLDVLTAPCYQTNGNVLVADSSVDGGFVPIVISTGETATGNNTEVIITNSSTCRTSSVLLTVDRNWEAWVVNGSYSEEASVSYDLMQYSQQGAIGTTVAGALTQVDSDGHKYALTSSAQFNIAYSRSRSLSFTLLPGTELRFIAASRISNVTTDTNGLNVRRLNARVSFMQVGF